MATSTSGTTPSSACSSPATPANPSWPAPCPAAPLRPPGCPRARSSPPSAASAVTSTAQLRRFIASYDPGQTVNLTWADTAGYSHTADVTLGRAPVA